MSKTEPPLLIPHPCEPIFCCLDENTDVLHACDEVFLYLHSPEPSPPRLFHPEINALGKAPFHKMPAGFKISLCLA